MTQQSRSACEKIVRSSKKLVKAIEQGSTFSLRSLLSKSNVNKIIDRQWFPLMLAAHHSQRAIVSVLINMGADVNKGVKGKTSIMFAAGKGDLATAKLLLRAGAVGPT